MKEERETEARKTEARKAEERKAEERKAEEWKRKGWKAEERKTEGRSLARKWISLLGRLVAAAAVLFLLQKYLVALHPVHYNSMFPAVRDGDLAFVLRTDRKMDAGDVVLVRTEDGRKLMRIAAISGSVVEIGGSGYRINGMIPAESVPYETTEPGEIGYPYTVPEKSDRKSVV